MRSAIAILTYRRLHAVKAMLEGVQKHCPQYACAVFEDCGQRDNTTDFLCEARTPESNKELMATRWVPEVMDPLASNYPNVDVYTGDVNLGVAGNSNRALKWFMDGDWDHLLLCNDDLFVLGDFANLYARAHQELGVGMFCFCDFTEASPAISGQPESYKWTTYPVRGWKVKFLPRFTGIMMSVTRKTVEAAGYFDASFGQFGEEHPCPAESPVWMADYTFKPITEIRVGDSVIGWQKRQAPAKRYGKEKGTEKGNFLCDTLQKSTVLAVIRLERPLIEVQFASGRKIRCAPEHTWLNYHGVKSGNRVYIPAEIGKDLVHVVDTAERLTETLSYTNGYVHGLVAGDGGMDHGAVVQRTTNEIILKRLHRNLGQLQIRFTTTQWDYAEVKPAKRRFTDPGRILTITRLDVDYDFLTWKPNTREEWRGWLAGVYDADGYGRSFGQCPFTHPDVYERIAEGLAVFAFETKRQKHQIYLKGGWRELVRFWNLCQPSLSYKLDDAVLVGRFKTKDKVVNIIELPGRHSVYCLKTSTGNYVIQGYASKNCDWTIRCRLAGGIRLNNQDMNCLDIEHGLLKHQDVETSMPRGFERQQADSEASYIMQEAARSYAYWHFYRPFRLKMPAKAGGYRGGGIPAQRLLEYGYNLITDLV
jgi:hypothetical protein